MTVDCRAFVQNQRDEPRYFGGDGQSVGALSAQPGLKQQTFVMTRGGDSVSSYGCNIRAGTQEPECSQTIQSKVNSLNSTNPVLTEDTADAHAVTIHDGTRWVVRRLTPRECERLQGFPDDWTDIPWKGKEHAPDGVRYKAIGNSMAVPVMLWLGKRIQEVEDGGCDS